MNYYNEFDKKAAAWLRELIKANLIPDGEVDERSIADVKPRDLDGFKQCHFFAGIGGWPYALRLAGWPDNRPVWTGSCPCQPFSVAGKGKGLSDERHLWPAFRWLIAKCRPAAVFGEQVASKDGRLWLAGVRSDLEAMGYAVGAADLCAAGVGAPHIRQRLWWCGRLVNSKSKRPNRDAGSVQQENGGQVSEQVREPVGTGEVSCRMGNATVCGRQHKQTECEVNGAVEVKTSVREQSCGTSNGMPDGRLEISGGDGIGNHNRQTGGQGRESMDAGTESLRQGHGKVMPDGVAAASRSGRLADSIESGLERHTGNGDDRNEPGRVEANEAGPVAEGCNTHWSTAVWHPCKDGKARRIPAEPALFPLAHGISGRVGLLRGAGNAIVPQVAAEFIQAFMEC